MIDATKRKQARSLGTILHGNPLIKVTIWNLKKWSHMLALFLCLSPFSLYLYRSHSLRYASVIISWIQTASPSTTTPILSLTRIQTGWRRAAWRVGSNEGWQWESSSRRKRSQCCLEGGREWWEDYVIQIIPRVCHIVSKPLRFLLWTSSFRFNFLEVSKFQYCS